MHIIIAFPFVTMDWKTTVDFIILYGGLFLRVNFFVNCHHPRFGGGGGGGFLPSSDAFIILNRQATIFSRITSNFHKFFLKKLCFMVLL